LKTNDILSALRAKMTRHGVDALIIPSGDPHQSEYTAAHWQARHWLTGFKGSAGTAVVTHRAANLWTDFRYWIQAEAQMDGFLLFKQGDDGVPDYDEWLAGHLDGGACIALDGRMVSAAQTKKLRKVFKDYDIHLDTTIDLISDLWTDRPPMPATKAFVLSESFAGQTRREKLDAIRRQMEKKGADAHLMSALDDIAWTFNLRGADVHTNPVNLAFALIEPDKTRLFINPAKLDANVTELLEGDGIGLLPYEDVDNALSQLSDGTKLLIQPEAVSDHLHRAANPGCKLIEGQNPATGLKCIKNPVETCHIKETAVKDGRAVVRFLHWLATTEEQVTEISAAAKILAFRQAESDFIDPSFDSIMAFGDHSAMCHYAATEDTDVPLTRDAMFLNDSGGNYLTGTTDITRTLHLGTPTDREIRDYTLVLRGHIAVATSKFPVGTRGYQVDTLARQYLWQQGMDFGHGTGHGVGFFLCVHEGPARISPHPVDQVLKPGMLLTNEPGLYREGEYGIRLENMVMVAEDETTVFGKFLRFENITLCHFERNLIDKTLLTDTEIRWLDNYHRTVYDALAPGLPENIQSWLADKTKGL